MKFNLSDFVQLDTKGLLAVNGGYYCNGSSNTSVYSNPYYTGNSGSGTCSSKKDTDKVSGMFGQITDGSYADTLTMQYYKNMHTVDGYVTNEVMSDTKDGNNEVIDVNSFSTDACLMTGIAKIVSEKTGKDIIPLDVSNAIDKNYDGLVSFDEIKNNVNELFGDEYDVNVDYWTKEGKLDKDKFVEISNTPDTYVLGRAYGDFDGDGTYEHHWVVLEGFTSDRRGRLCFDYDGTSDNDAKNGRTYYFGGTVNGEQTEYTIDKIETITVVKR
ncbi:MAG: hypothetical protein K6F15_06105 [Treponema sp.]|nr:hypothetical protein [Treponema sp.]